MNPVRQAVIIAGGLGTRLISVNGNKPKILTEINGISLLEIQLKEIVSAGFKRATFLLGANAELVIQKIYELQKAFRNRLKIDWIVEAVKLGTGGSLINSLNVLEESFMVIYGDLYINVDLEKLATQFYYSGAQFACVVHPTNHMFDSDLVEIDENNDIIGFHLKVARSHASLRNLANTGIYFFQKSSFANESQGSQDLDRSIIPLLMETGARGVALRHHGFIRDIGTPERLVQVSKYLLPESFHQFKRPTLLLDRDGVLNKHVGYVTNSKQIELVPGICQLIARFNEAKYWVLVFTNQPVIAHGTLSKHGLDNIHAYIDGRISRFGAYIDDYFVCPHHPDGGYEGEIKSLKSHCVCRKPNLGLLDSAKERYRIDLTKSIMIGDTWRDEQFANRAGVKYIPLDRAEGVEVKLQSILNNVIPHQQWWQS
jgi:histidinol-phosphate phosphatase family protein